MSDSNHSTQLPEDLELLLPWYQAGRLSEEDQQRVESYLAAHPEARMQLDLIDEEAELVRTSADRMPKPSASAFDHLMRQLETDEKPSLDLSAAEGALAKWLGRLFPVPAPALRAGLAACLLLVALQFGALVFLSVGDTEPGFETAAGGDATVGGGDILLVSFSPGASAAQITSLLEGIGARIVDGPRAGGVYRVELPQDADSGNIVSALKERPDIVAFASVSGE